MTEDKPVYIISDSSEKESVEFGFDAYARTIADLIANKKIKRLLLSASMAPGDRGRPPSCKR